MRINWSSIEEALLDEAHRLNDTIRNRNFIVTIGGRKVVRANAMEWIILLLDDGTLYPARQKEWAEILNLAGIKRHDYWRYLDAL